MVEQNGPGLYCKGGIASPSGGCRTVRGAARVLRPSNKNTSSDVARFPGARGRAPSPNCTRVARVGDAFRAIATHDVPRDKALGYSLGPFHGRSPFTRSTRFMLALGRPFTFHLSLLTASLLVRHRLIPRRWIIIDLFRLHRLLLKIMNWRR